MIRRVAFALALYATLLPGQTLKKQARDGAPVQAMTAMELAALGDPLFRLVLRTNRNESRFDKVVRLLKGATGSEQFFVVDERIVNSATAGQTRRAVVGFNGSNQGLSLNPNVMLSITFNPNAVQPGFNEAWGWDDARSRYNYYKLDAEGGSLSWKFRGSSVDADKLTLAQRTGTCMACHINGGPVMKELPFPWNNWSSFRSQAAYLTPGGANHWPIAEGAHLATLSGAEDMEIDFILPSIRQFNGRRIERLIRRNASGKAAVFQGGLQEVTDGRRALRPLFETTEYNAISSSAFSGLHPIAPTSPGPPLPVPVPDTFFLNANVLAGGGPTQYQGLGISQARDFATLLTVQPNEYRTLVTGAATKLDNKPGDSNFAWFVPEASHSDNHMIDSLVKGGLITPQFAAAVLAADLENPVFSTRTPSLLRFVPAMFRFKPRTGENLPATHPDALTRTVIAALQAAAPAAGSAEADFLALLRDPDPVKVLRQRVQAYLAREQAALSNPTTRPAELKRLFDRVIARRRATLANPLFRPLNETGNLLFAVP